MKYTTRSYQSKTDLYQIGQLIRRSQKKREYFNAWSFCRFEIWSQRRIADEESFHQQDMASATSSGPIGGRPLSQAAHAAQTK